MDAIERHLEVILHNFYYGGCGLYAQIYTYQLLDNPSDTDSGRLMCIYSAVQNHKDRRV